MFLAREFETEEEILSWADSLDERWPERLEIRDKIVELVRELRCGQGTIVELSSGDGRLARDVLLAVPDARYIGVDASESLCAYVNEQQGIETLTADLSQPGWEDTLN